MCTKLALGSSGRRAATAGWSLENRREAGWAGRRDAGGARLEAGGVGSCGAAGFPSQAAVGQHAGNREEALQRRKQERGAARTGSRDEQSSQKPEKRRLR